MTAYYNENDKHAAAWLRELIKAGLIADGIVDERSIEDVTPDDLKGFTQCHFFAGIGGWSYALRLAGWPDDKPVWTGSCPCQPFSAAGKSEGFADERHLWPAFFHLISQCRPAIVFGEQVASRAADNWVDLVQADMEALDYAFGCVPFPSASVGAPHIRDRNYWMGITVGAGLEGLGGHGSNSDESRWLAAEQARPVTKASTAFRLADLHSTGCDEGRERCKTMGHGQAVEPDSSTGRLADTTGDGCQRQGQGSASEEGRQARPLDGRQLQVGLEGRPVSVAVAAPIYGTGTPVSAGALHGFWRDADWLLCRDGKWRPVKSGSFPLANGLSARMVRLRGYGNAINPHQAAVFIRAAMK